LLHEPILLTFVNFFSSKILLQKTPEATFNGMKY